MSFQSKTRVWWIAAALAGFATAGPARAQHISIDGRLSPAQTLVGPNYAIGANLGKQVGGNLFQSFGVFGLSSGESATFTGPATVNNVIGRVTGGSTSSINGAIKSTIAGANVYLINPAGIVFGPNATINVSGSFHASTADYLRLSDGSRFRATSPVGSTLSAAPPAAFGFLNTAPPAIRVNGSTLGVGQGQTLDLAGGPISLTGATLQAPGGTLHVAGVAGTGEIAVDPLNRAASTATRFAPVTIRQNSSLSVSNPSGVGGSGSVFVSAGALTVDASQIGAGNFGPATGGPISVAADSLSIAHGGGIASIGFATGDAGPVTITSKGALSLNDGQIADNTFGTGNAGALSVTAGSGAMIAGGEILSLTFGSGHAGAVSVAIGGTLTVDGTGGTQNLPSGIFSQTLVANGDAGRVAVTAKDLSVINGAEISTSTFGAGHGGEVFVNAGNLFLSSNGVIRSDAFSTGNAGQVNITAGDMEMISSGHVASTTRGLGNAGSVSVDVSGLLTVDGTGSTEMAQSGISALALFGNTGNAGRVSVNAGSLSVVNAGSISTTTFGTGEAGRIDVTAGNVSVASGGSISSLTFSAANAGEVNVTAGSLSLDGGNISTTTFGAGMAGRVAVSAATASLVNGGNISSSTFGSGLGGSVRVDVAGALSMDGVNSGIVSEADFGSTGNAGAVNVAAGSLALTAAAQISSNTFAAGDAGSVVVDVAHRLSIDGAGAPPGVAGIALATGIGAQTSSGSAGNGGRVSVTAGDLALANGGAISTTTRNRGNGGDVVIDVAGAVSIAGKRSAIASQAARDSTGNAGSVAISAAALTVDDGGQITTATHGPGAGGDIDLAIGGAVLLSGTGPQITAATTAAGNAGSIALTAGSLSMVGGARLSSDTTGGGNAGGVALDVSGAVTLTGRPERTTGIFSQANAGSSGNAGTIQLAAGSLSMSDGARISSTTFAPGNAGSVVLDITGAVTLQGATASGVATGIFSAASGGSTGNAGSIRLAAGSLSIADGGKIATTTDGIGVGGDIDLAVGGNILLSGPGPQIAAGSTGSGNAGSITVSAANLSLQNGASISTQAATANGGNIALSVADFLYLVSSKITTSVGGASGNGGNIAIASPLLVLNHSSIIAQAVAGHGGNITIAASDFIPSNDSIVSASSQLGISGAIELIGPRVDLNGSLVVLSSELRAAAEVLRTSCDAHGRNRSSLVDAGQGGLPQDTETTIPALYIADRDLGLPAALPPGKAAKDRLRPPPVRQVVRLTMGCG